MPRLCDLSAAVAVAVAGLTITSEGFGATVALDDGTVRVGTVDAQAADDALLLCEGTARCYVASRIAWGRIVSVAEDGRTYAGHAFRLRSQVQRARIQILKKRLAVISAAEQSARAGAADALHDLDPLTGQHISQAEAIIDDWGTRQRVAAVTAYARWCTANGYPSAAQAAYLTVRQLVPGHAEATASPPLRREPESTPRPPKVVGVETHSAIADWDGDADIDGLEMLIVPRDAEGHVVPVDGWLDVEVTGQKLRPRRSTLNAVRLESWRVRIDATRFTPQGILVRLPYSSYTPDVREPVAAHGKVAAKLFVFGQGDFHAQEPVVRLRPYDPLGDEDVLVRPPRFRRAP